jgi:23S rRNA G2069 N7-methylase RlmK/C1962 C5-methylase RlmI
MHFQEAQKALSMWIHLKKRVEIARENIRLNGFSLSKCTFINEDVKNYLRNIEGSFPLIILDPPAFVKDRRKINEGIAVINQSTKWH